MAYKALNGDVIDTRRHIGNCLTEVETTMIDFDDMQSLRDIAADNRPTGEGSIVLIRLNLIVGSIPATTPNAIFKAGVLKEDCQVCASLYLIHILGHPSANERLHICNGSGDFLVSEQTCLTPLCKGGMNVCQRLAQRAPFVFCHLCFQLSELAILAQEGCHRFISLDRSLNSVIAH